jgi:hypothetical protein
MQASIGQYSMQAGEPAQPVQQSVVMAKIRGFFLRAALPSPIDIGKCFSIIEIMLRLLFLPIAFEHQSTAPYFNMARGGRSTNYCEHNEKPPIPA